MPYLNWIVVVKYTWTSGGEGVTRQYRLEFGGEGDLCRLMIAVITDPLHLPLSTDLPNIF